MIIIEGIDNTGKSTIAQRLSSRLSLPVQGSEGPPRYPGELIERLTRYATFRDCIFDRHPVVSQPIYRTLRHLGEDAIVPLSFVDQLYEKKPFFIYCDPPAGRGLSGHLVKQRDSSVHLAAIAENYADLLSAYRGWAMQYATWWYRIGDDVDHLVNAVAAVVKPFDPVGDVEAFHRKYHPEYNGDSSRDLIEERAMQRRGMGEELEEYDLACTPEDQLDALIDSVYWTLGMAYLQGFDFREGWRRVQEANMLKVRAERANDSKRGSSFDVVKPPGWQPPNLSDLVSRRIVTP